MVETAAPSPRIGDVLGPMVVSKVAHGGHWVARHEGRVYFVRHALEGEVVTVRVTGVAKRHAFADVVAVLQHSPLRVTPPCPVAGRCGGCDLQHVAIEAQSDLKRQVVAEQLARLAQLTWDGVVETVDPPALGWRRRMRYHGSAQGWGLRAHGSAEVVALPEQGCLIATPALARPAEASVRRAAGVELVGAQSAEGVTWLEPGDRRLVSEQAAGRSWQVRADGFWQVHPQAPDVLVDAVVGGLVPEPGDRVLDLYCGVGLFAGALVDAGADVIGIEADADAVACARRNVPEASFIVGRVDRGLRSVPPDADLIVLDPPRAGAGERVMTEVLARRPRRVAYVACDPASLARDVATAARLGWRAASVRAFDLFGMTHHVECVAILEPSA